MGFLNPLFLLAGLAVAVPLILHLFHRQEVKRVSFPALRYLQRTTREHARRIRLRQLLLLLVRVATVVLLVLAGARLFVPGGGGTHRPTALAIVLDNSLSSGVVVGEARLLDHMKDLALGSVEEATGEDRIWVIRAGEPWDPAVPGGPARARLRILETNVSAAAGNLVEALDRAAALVRGAEMPEAEIHLISDLQATAFPDGERPDVPPDVRLLVYRSTAEPEPNLRVETLSVGGGLAPLAGERTELAVGISGPEDAAGDSVSLRLVLDGRVVGAALAVVGSEAVLPAGPFPGGRVEGWVEIDPDALRADDRRFFAFTARPAPAVALVGPSSFFLREAVSVLEDRGRARPAPPRSADVLLSVGGEGLESRQTGTAVVVVPAPDVTVLPALNRRLASSGVPWRYEPRGEAAGEVGVRENRLPQRLEGLRIYSHFSLTPAAEGPDGDVLVTLTDGAPWLVSGRSPQGPYLLLASPLGETETDLPLTAAMMPLLEWVVTRWSAADEGSREVIAGGILPVPAEVTAVIGPSGRRQELDGSSRSVVAGEAGLYRFAAGDSIVAVAAVNPPASESRLERVDPAALEARLGVARLALSDSAGWRRETFGSRQGPEPWALLVAAAVLLLVFESWIAAAGRVEPPRVGEPRPEVGS